MNTQLSAGKIFVWALCAFLCGIAAVLFFPLPLTFYFACIFAGVLIVLVAHLRRKTVCIGILLCAFGIGCIRALYAVLLDDVAAQNVSAHASDKPEEMVLKAHEVHMRQKGQRIIASRLENGAMLFLSAPQYPRIAEGDHIRVSCTLADRSGQRASFQRYLRSRGLVGTCTTFSLERILPQGGIGSLVRSVRDHLVARIHRVIPSPESDMIASILFGGVLPLPPDIFLAFQRIGVSHITAASGMNIALVANFGTVFLRTLGIARRVRYPFILLCIIFYTFLAGAVPSIVRAALFAAAMLFAQWCKRTASSLRILLLVGAVMLVWNPFLLFQLSFQLSFAGVLGLSVLAPLIEPFMTRLPQTFSIRKIAAETSAATLATLPLTIVAFEVFSTVSLLANIVMIPLASGILLAGMAWLMFASSVAALPSPVGFTLSFLAALPVWAAASLMIGMARILSVLPFASVALSLGSWGWVVFVTSVAGIGWFCWFLRVRTRCAIL